MIPCHFEPDSEAKIINTLRNPTVVSSKVVFESSAEQLLKYIANQSYGALIDCGALITGYSNEEVHSHPHPKTHGTYVAVPRRAPAKKLA